MATQATRPEAVPAKPDVRPFFVGWSVYVLIVALFGVLLLRAASPSFDFRTFYAAGYLVRTQPSQLYDLGQQQQVQSALVSPGEIALPFLHPSYEALLFAPFSLLRYQAAYFSFIAVNLLLLAGIFVAAYPLFAQVIPVWQPRPGLMLFPYLPLLLTIWHGQDSLVFLLLCCLVWRQLESGHDTAAGCLLAAGLFKFQLAIPMAILLAARRGWRFCAAFVATGAVVVALCIEITGGTGAAMMLRLLTAGSLAGDNGTAAQQAMVIKPLAMPNLFGLLFPVTQHLPSRLAFVVVATVSLTVLAWCAYLVRAARQERVAFAISILCGGLVSYHMYLYDLTLLLLAVALLGAQAGRRALLLFYGVPLIVLLFTGPRWIFLLAIPALALLWRASRQANARTLTAAPATT